MENQISLAPEEIYQADERTLGIRWKDGHQSLYLSYYLRKACRCAACIDEMSGASILNPAKIPEDIHPVEIQGVGRYGIRINWSDQHNTGIYDFKYLREICPCAECSHG